MPPLSLWNEIPIVLLLLAHTIYMARLFLQNEQSWRRGAEKREAEWRNLMAQDRTQARETFIELATMLSKSHEEGLERLLRKLE